VQTHVADQLARSKKEPEWLAPVLDIMPLENLFLTISSFVVGTAYVAMDTQAVNLWAYPTTGLIDQPPFVNPAPRRIRVARRCWPAMIFRCSRPHNKECPTDKSGKTVWADDPRWPASSQPGKRWMASQAIVLGGTESGSVAGMITPAAISWSRVVTSA